MINLNKTEMNDQLMNDRVILQMRRRKKIQLIKLTIRTDELFRSVDLLQIN